MDIHSPQLVPFWFKALLFTGILHLLALEAVGQVLDERPAVLVYPKAIVKNEVVYLADVSRITSGEKGYEELARALGRVRLAESLAPKTTTTITGVRLLEIIEESGIARDSFGYSIPQAVEIERAGRIVEREELLNFVREQLAKEPDFDLQVRDVTWANAQIIPLGETQFRLQRLGAPSGGRIPLRLSVLVNQVPAARFIATAVVDDWREVPVLSRTLERGMLIRPDDIQVVRLNMLKQPLDVAASADDVVGLRVKNRIQAGETLRRSLIDIPAMIPQGTRVVMIYNAPGLKATATGVALEDGQKGASIQVRNASSKKVVKAVVVSPDTVTVGGE